MTYGVYVHFPICTRACYYCDFFFHANLKKIPAIEEAILREISLRKKDLPSSAPVSLYFGGGTPSLASPDFLENVLVHFPAKQEITLEVNPEDVSEIKVKTWKALGINRVSLGVQALEDEILRKLNRPHTGKEALQALEQIANYFDNFSVDFILGIPFETRRNVVASLKTVIENFSPSHFSVYILTLEENTAFARFLKRGTMMPLQDSQAEEEYFATRNYLLSSGYEHYEISNYALRGKEAVHNSLYWKHLPYYGFGPSAHSFRPWKRYANVSKMTPYISQILQGKIPLAFHEELGNKEIFNEKIMLGLRRLRVGFSLSELLTLSEKPEFFLKKIKRLSEEGFILQKEDRILLSQKGLLLSDYVSGELFAE